MFKELNKLIKLDFLKGDNYAHEELVNIFYRTLSKKAKFILTSFDYFKDKKRKRINLGEIDLCAKIGNTLFIFEMKTNNDLDSAIKCLKHHKKKFKFNSKIIKK